MKVTRRKWALSRIIFAVSVVCSGTVFASGDHGTPGHPEWAEALNAAGKPITVYSAKKIYTMDPARPEATAIAVLDGRVLSTGSLESMQPWLSRYKHTIDKSLKDKIILPGFIEPHTHPWVSAGARFAYVGGPDGVIIELLEEK